MTRSAAGADEALGSNSPLRYLPRAIRTARRPFRAIAVGWLVSFPVSMGLAIISSLVLPDVERPQFEVDGLAAILALVVFAPVAETLIMGIVLLGLLAVLPAPAAVIASAIGWGVAHSLVAPVWGLVIWWPFLVFSTLFVAWRSRSLVLAFLIPACVHALQNLIPALLVANGVSA